MDFRGIGIVNPASISGGSVCTSTRCAGKTTTGQGVLPTFLWLLACGATENHKKILIESRVIAVWL